MISISTGTNLRYHITTKDQVLSPPQAAYKMNPEVGNTKIFSVKVAKMYKVFQKERLYWSRNWLLCGFGGTSF